MWKYVTRRVRDTFERSANHFDRCSTTVVNNAPNNFGDEINSKHPCCKWFASKKCWNSFRNDRGANNKKWKFEHLNKNWMNAITWSGAAVLGWYTSPLLHLKLKHHLRTTQKCCLAVNDLLSSLQPFRSSGDTSFYLNSPAKIKKIVPEFITTVHLVANDQDDSNVAKLIHSASSGSDDSSDDDLGEVLNSIENKLGLAAIENGQYQDGLSLLRSAANRNHAPAIYNLGLCYENGLGVNMNEKTAMELYKSAAALNHAGALYNLGIFYGQGRGGLKSDQETATRLLRLAAVQGQQNAIDALKTLDVPISDPPRSDNWNYQPPPFMQSDNIVPSHISLFVDNLNFQTLKYEVTF